MPESPFKIVSFRQNSFIMIEGKADAADFFIIRAGKVQLSKEMKAIEDTSTPSILGPGDFFGVISCMSSHKRMETAVAMTDVSLIAIPREHFGTLIQKNAPIAMKIIRLFSHRLRFYDSEITKLTLKDSSHVENIENLFQIGEYYFKLRQFNLATYVYKKYVKYLPNGNNVATVKARLGTLGITNIGESGINLPANSLTQSYTDGSMIFCENEPGEELYIIQQGKVKITKIITDKEILLAVLKEGDILEKWLFLKINLEQPLLLHTVIW